MAFKAEELEYVCDNCPHKLLNHSLKTGKCKICKCKCFMNTEHFGEHG